MRIPPTDIIMNNPDQVIQALDNLRKQWRTVAAIYFFAILCTVAVLWKEWQASIILPWVLLAILVSVYELWLVRVNLHLNRRPDETYILPNIGLGTALTLTRGLSYVLLAGFFLTPWPDGALAWLPALLYTLGGIADYLDGYVARKTDTATVLGEILDMEFDALGLLVVVGVSIHFGQLPLWYLVVGLARYAFVLGMRLLQRRGKPIYELPPSNLRRVLAGLQMGLMSVILWPILSPALATLAGIVFAVPFLVGFLRDWLVVSGALDAQSPRYLLVRAWTTRAMTDWLPIVIRLLTAFSAAMLLINNLIHFELLVALLAERGYNYPDIAAALFALIELVAIPFIALGVAGRFFALLLVVPLGFTILAAGFSAESLTALVGSLYLVLFGTGDYSLWKPEDRIMQRRIGQQDFEEV